MKVTLPNSIAGIGLGGEEVELTKEQAAKFGLTGKATATKVEPKEDKPVEDTAKKAVVTPKDTKKK